MGLMNQPETTTPDDSSLTESSLFVVAVGASAGGVRPLEEFFATVQPSDSVAFVVIQHLSPSFKSLMDDILGRRTKMPIRVAEHGMELMGGTVTLLPPAHLARVSGEGKIALEAMGERVHGQISYPIDVFFASLARAKGEQAVAIVLSGTGTDGSRGIRDVSDHGGLVLVQSPESAEFDGMPRSAILTRVADVIEPPDVLAQAVERYASGTDLHSISSQESSVSYDDPLLGRIASILRSHGYPDFSGYKPATLLRRIDRRRRVRGISETAEYIRLIADSEEERDALADDLLINVTAFFRDPPAWRTLEEDAVPSLVEQARRTGELRIWVTACSTGEEAYSVAMMCLEEVNRVGADVKVRVFATDIDGRAVAQAMEGEYAGEIANDISEERLRKYFTPTPRGFRVTPDLRRQVVFAQHDLIRDPPFTRMDLITCRNVLIYMRPELQAQVLGSLNYALNVGGILFLGPAETFGEVAGAFATIHRKWRIGRKVQELEGPRSFGRLQGRQPLPSLPLPEAAPRRRPSPGSLEETLHRWLSNDDTAFLIFDEHHRLAEAYGRTEYFLRHPVGTVSTHVDDMLREPLVVPTRAGIARALDSGEPSRFDAMTIQIDGVPHLISLDVLRLAEPSEGAPTRIAAILKIREGIEASDSSVMTYDAGDEAAERIRQLESELAQTRARMQTLIEELETTNEEQQSTNEELLASNEELQSTNQELHSVNEELYTVNAEYQLKIDELTQLSEDVDNLLRSTNVGVMYLDAKLAVRRYTPAAASVVNVVEHDIGRTIEHITHQMLNLNLVDALRVTQKSRAVFERDVWLRDGRSMLVRIHPYIRAGHPTDSLVITFVDITERNHVETALKDSELRFRSIFNRSSVGIFTLDPVGRIESSNLAMERVTGMSEDDLLDRDLAEIFAESDRDRVREKIEAAFAERDEELHIRARLDAAPDVVLELSLLAVSIDDDRASYGIGIVLSPTGVLAADD